MNVIAAVAGFAWPLLLVAAGVVLGLLVQRLVLDPWRRVAEGTPSRVDDLLLSSLRGPVVWWGAIAGAYAALEIAELPTGVERVARATLLILAILSATWILARLSGSIADRTIAGSRSDLPGASLVTNLAKLTVTAIGILVALQTLGISITPMLTALGVGALAVGLALQDTLGNFFVGIHILTSRQIVPGDFVRLPSGEEGYVQDITWRYTAIRQLSNNMTIVPNSVFAGTTITNYYRPDPELAVLVNFGVAYGSDLAHVERVTVEVGREVMREVPGGVPTFEPFIRYGQFGDARIEVTVILRGREAVDQYLLRHEFIKRLHVRYAAEGIEIPFIERVYVERVYVRQDGSPATPPAPPAPPASGAPS
jgi:small-conductance mechanosensitive channel